MIEPQWIEQALYATGKAFVRRRKLPAEHVLWLVMGLALFRNQPIWHVVRPLDLTLHGQPLAVSSASVQSRQHLGEEPLTIVRLAHPHLDTTGSSSQYGSGSQPQIRAACLMDTHTHELLDARLGSMAQAELTLAAELQGCDQSLTVFDRAYFWAAFLLRWQAGGEQRHWLVRAKDNLRYEVLIKHGKGDDTIAMTISPHAGQLQLSLPSH